MIGFASLAWCSVCILPSFAATGEVARVAVRTWAKSNPNPSIWYRVPCDYRKVPGRRWRTLVIFGGRNCGGEAEVSGKLGWPPWADRYGVFLVAPGFRDDRYWEPSAWSGKALLSALAEIRKSYDIDTEHLLYYGYSAGSQAANLFAAWRPDLCRAWVSHACGVFHTPSMKMRNTPGLVTCGDADTARDILSRDFMARARAVGQPVVWRSFPNHPHDVPPGSLALARAFLAHYDAVNRGDLGGGGALGDRAMPDAPFVGDDPDGTYWPAGSAEARSIPPEDRVPLPGRLVAEAWGKEGVVRRTETAPVGGRWRFSVDGVEVVCRAPAACRCVPARGSWRSGVGGRGGGDVHASGCRLRGWCFRPLRRACSIGMCFSTLRKRAGWGRSTLRFRGRSSPRSLRWGRCFAGGSAFSLGRKVS